MRKYLLPITAVICALFLTANCSAQLEVSSGLEVSYPELVNSNNTKLNYGQITFGVRAGVAYKPHDTQFFPILNVSFGRTRLPIKQFGENVAVLNFNYLNVMLNENYVITMPRSEVYIYGGVGFSYLMNQGIQVAGRYGETMHASIDSTKNVNNVFPAMNIGFEYNYGESAGKDLYITMGINFQYILLLADRNTYYVSVAAPGNNYYKYQSNLSGNVISPGFYLAIHYVFRKKKSSFYL